MVFRYNAPRSVSSHEALHIPEGSLHPWRPTPRDGARTRRMKPPEKQLPQKLRQSVIGSPRRHCTRKDITPRKQDHRNELILLEMMFKMIENNEKIPKQGRKVYEALAKKLGQSPNVWDRWRHRFNDVILPKLHTFPADPEVILTILKAVKRDVSEVHLAMERSLKMKITLENGVISEWEKNEKDDVVMENGLETEIPQIVYLSSDPETQRVELAELKRRGELFEARFPGFRHLPDWDLDESSGTLGSSSVGQEDTVPIAIETERETE
ncbi:unnamed protein product [Caenorhabditis brenneri]